MRPAPTKTLHRAPEARRQGPRKVGLHSPLRGPGAACPGSWLCELARNRQRGAGGRPARHRSTAATTADIPADLPEATSALHVKMTSDRSVSSTNGGTAHIRNTQLRRHADRALRRRGLLGPRYFVWPPEMKQRRSRWREGSWPSGVPPSMSAKDRASLGAHSATPRLGNGVHSDHSEHANGEVQHCVQRRDYKLVGPEKRR
jgi:hypothetical protein